MKDTIDILTDVQCHWETLDVGCVVLQSDALVLTVNFEMGVKTGNIVDARLIRYCEITILEENTANNRSVKYKHVDEH